MSAGWKRDLLREGIEPNPGPTMHAVLTTLAQRLGTTVEESPEFRELEIKMKAAFPNVKFHRDEHVEQFMKEYANIFVSLFGSEDAKNIVATLEEILNETRIPVAPVASSAAAMSSGSSGGSGSMSDDDAMEISSDELDGPVLTIDELRDYLAQRGLKNPASSAKWFYKQGARTKAFVDNLLGTEDEKAPATTSTEKDAPTRALPAGKTWFMRRHDEDFETGIPDYIDFNKALYRVKKLITKRTADNWGVTAFDVPGAGKSTTIIRAAEETNSAYLRLKAGTGILGHIVRDMDKKTTTLPDEVGCLVLGETLTEVVHYWLTAVFDHCASRMQKTRELYFGSVDCDSAASTPDVKRALRELFDVVDTIRPEAAIVLHFDDVQEMSSDLKFKRAQRVEIVKRVEYADYYLVFVTLVLEDLKSSNVRFKAAVSGTNVFQDKILRVASEWKTKVIDVGQMPPSATRSIMEKYCNFQGLTEEQQSRFFESVSYNGRSVQFTLETLRRKFNEHTADEVTFAMAEAAAEEAYITWMGMLTNRLSDPQGTYRLMNELLLLFSLPEVFGAKVINRDVVSVSGSCFPARWSHYAVCSIFRTAWANEEVYIYRFKGFLNRYMTDTLAKRHWDQDIIMLFVSAYSLAYEAIGAKGHLFERMIAVELATPNSPFTRFVCSKLGMDVAPDPESVLQPVHFAAVIDSQQNMEHSVYCVADDPKVSGARLIDIAFPVIRHTLSPSYSKENIIVVCEAKAGYTTSELWRLCHDFFTCNLANFQNAPRVFFSRTAFTRTTVEQRQVQKGISGHDARKAVRSMMGVANKKGKRAKKQKKQKKREEKERKKFAIIEDKDFELCFSPILSLVDLALAGKQVRVYKDELKTIDATTFLSEFVPSVMESLRTDTPRKPLARAAPARTSSNLI